MDRAGGGYAFALEASGSTGSGTGTGAGQKVLAAMLSTSHVQNGNLEWAPAGSVPGNVLQHGPVRTLAVSPAGSFVWLLTGARVAFATATRVTTVAAAASPPLQLTPSSKTGSATGDKKSKTAAAPQQQIALDGKWVDVAKDVLCFAIDNTSAWFAYYTSILQT